MMPDVPGRFIRAVFLASKLRQAARKGAYDEASFSYQDGEEWEQAKVHMLLELDLRLQDASDVQKLKLCTARDLEGVPQDLITTSILRLESDETVLGFKLHEQGNGMYFNVQVLLQTASGLRAEPLSQELFYLKYPFPGREIAWQSAQQPPAEVAALWAFRGTERHHVLGLTYAAGGSIERATGKVAMFWVDLWLLTCSLYYIDVITDVQQLVLFLAEGQYSYFAMSCFGIAIPIVSTVVESVKWSENQAPRAQCDIFRRWVPSMAARLVLVVTSTVTQLHILLLVVASACMRTKHDLLQAAKQSEVVEAAISAALQGNYWCLIVVGIEAIPDASFRSLTVSVLTSCAALAYDFASRDKADAKVLHIPGKLKLTEPLFAALLLFRTLEVIGRLLAINMLHLATRSISVGGPVAVALLVAAAWRNFPEADMSQILGAALAHPGQVLLGDLSRLPLRISVWMQVVLQLVALSLQGLLHISNWPPQAKVVPWQLLALSLSASIVGSLGLCLLSRLGNKKEHPFLEQLAKEQVLTCTALATALDLQTVTVPVLAAVREITLDPDAFNDEEILQKLEKARTKVRIPATSMLKLQKHLGQDSEPILRVNVISVDFGKYECKELPAWKWDQCHWPLRSARLEWLDGNRLGEVFDLLCRCTELEEVSLEFVRSDLSDWQKLEKATWPKLRLAEFKDCFSSSESDKAAAVLAALAKCENLQVLDFWGSDVRREAWEALLGTTPWPALQWERCNFGFQTPSEDFRGPPQTQAVVAEPAAESKHEQMPAKRLTHFSLWTWFGTSKAALLKQLAACQDLETLDAGCCSDVPSLEWESLQHANWPQLSEVNLSSTFEYLSHGLQGSATVLKLLAASRHLKRINLWDCRGIPSEAWAALEGANWPNLRDADFGYCFVVGAPGCSKAAVVMKLLARCSHLERIGLSRCDGISGEDFEVLGAASWPELTDANFGGCFVKDDQAPGQRALLQMLSNCPKLKSLDMVHCRMKERHLWELPAGCWPELQVFESEGAFEQELERLRGVPKKPKKKARKKVSAKEACQADENTAAEEAQDEAACGSAGAPEVEQPMDAGEPLEAPRGTERKKRRRKKYRLVKRTGASARREPTPT